MEHLLSVLLLFGDRFVGFVPGWLLRRWYTVPKLAQLVVVVPHGVGPHLYVQAGKPLQISGLRLVVFNPLPFAVELYRLNVKLSLEHTYLLTLEKNDRTVVARWGIAQLDLNHDLADNQARMIQQHSCPQLWLSGEAFFRGRVREFAVHLEAGARAFRVPERS